MGTVTRTANGGDPIVELRHVSKRFGSTQALADVSLAIGRGEVHGLVGENGAGKSTLGRIIGGIVAPDQGQLRVAGATMAGWTTRQALAAGVVTIQQELSLVPDLSVARNVFLGLEDHRLGFLRGGLGRRFTELQAAAGFDLDPAAPVRRLRIADRQKVEILRALARDARVIVMDEPTSSLTADETARLHEVIGRLRREGRTVVYVTHFLAAALEQCERVTVLRDGRLIRTSDASRETPASLVEAMLGRTLEVTFPPLPTAPAPAASPALVLRDVRSGSAVKGISLEVRPGEIVGLAGLVGSGRTEVARVVYGADPLEGGEVVLGGRVYRRASPRASVRRRLVMIPEDRRHQGLVLDQPVARNISLPHLARFSRGGFVSLTRERAAVSALVDRFDVHPRRTDLAVGALSGGNQQKVLFAKWVVDDPRVVLLDEPTRGIDVGAKQQIYRLIVELAASGAAILLISSELEEVMGLSHRVYLLDGGRVLDHVDPRQASVDDVLVALLRGARPAPLPEAS